MGGGVFILVHQDLVAEEKAELVTECEIEWVSIKLKGNKNLLVSSYYMPHRNMNDVSELRRSLKSLNLNSKDRHVIIAGDFNCPDIDWQSLSVRKDAQDREVQQALLDLATDFNLTQVHDEPTRQNNLSDLVFTTNPSLIKSTANAPGISDHDMVVVDSDTKPFYAKQRPQKCFTFSKANWDQLKANISELSQEILRFCHRGLSVQDLWDRFKTDLNTAINTNIPSKMMKSNHSAPWITLSVKRLMKKKACLYKKAKQSKNLTTYRKFQKECKRQIRKSEWTYINNVINEGHQNNNTKPFWKYTKAKREDNIGIASLKNKGQLITDCLGRAEILVDQFLSVFTKEDDQPLPRVSRRVEEDLPPLKISEEGVLKLLRNIKVNKAAGPDELPQTGYYKSVLLK